MIMWWCIKLAMRRLRHGLSKSNALVDRIFHPTGCHWLNRTLHGWCIDVDGLKRTWIMNDVFLPFAWSGVFGMRFYLVQFLQINPRWRMKSVWQRKNGEQHWESQTLKFSGIRTTNPLRIRNIINEQYSLVFAQICWNALVETMDMEKKVLHLHHYHHHHYRRRRIILLALSP